MRGPAMRHLAPSGDEQGHSLASPVIGPQSSSMRSSHTADLLEEPQMSHHADYPLDPRLDITDVYCFTGTMGTAIRPSTVFVMNVAPLQSRGWNPDGYYEFRVDTTAPLDYIEDITWRVTFPADAAGVQHVRIEQLVGQAARDRNATGEVITPDGASLEQVITCTNGITFFAGERGDPFFNDARFTAATRTALS